MARFIAVLVAIACLTALIVESRPRPRDNSPSRLERTCPAGQFFVPCFIKDEALSQQWEA